MHHCLVAERRCRSCCFGQSGLDPASSTLGQVQHTLKPDRGMIIKFAAVDASFGRRRFANSGMKKRGAFTSARARIKVAQSPYSHAHESTAAPPLQAKSLTQLLQALHVSAWAGVICGAATGGASAPRRNGSDPARLTPAQAQLMRSSDSLWPAAASEWSSPEAHLLFPCIYAA
ncbi:hypothetical protein MRX96_029422 [Rhipicephalus microplus]